MKKLLLSVSLILLVLTAYSQTKKDGSPDMRYSSNKGYSSSTYSSTKVNSSSYTGSRPVYSGQTHTTSHGGTYLGESNSKTHKGGTYVNSRSGNHYGIHKKWKTIHEILNDLVTI